MYPQRIILILTLLGMTTSAYAQTAKAPNIDIWKAAAEGNTAAIKQHLASGTDVNAQEPAVGNTPLILASASMMTM